VYRARDGRRDLYFKIESDDPHVEAALEELPPLEIIAVPERDDHRRLRSLVREPPTEEESP